MKSKRAINSRLFALNPPDRFARFRIRDSLREYRFEFLSFTDDQIWYSSLYQGICQALSIILYHTFSFQDYRNYRQICRYINLRMLIHYSRYSLIYDRKNFLRKLGSFDTSWKFGGIFRKTVMHLTYVRRYIRISKGAANSSLSIKIPGAVKIACADDRFLF